MATVCPERIFRLVQDGDLLGLRTLGLNDDVTTTLRMLRRARSGDTLVHVAARKGHLDLMRYLLEELNLDLEVPNREYKRPLHEAASMSHRQCVRYLLERGAQVDSLKSALHGHLDVVDILLQRCGYRPDERDSCGVTPFMDALKHGHVEVARLLMDRHKPDKRAADALGAQALHQAAMTGQDHSIRFLITELGVDVNSRATSMNFTALHYAAKEGHTKTILTLRDLGADLQATDAKGRTARLMASAGGHAACAQALDQTCMQNHTSTSDFTTHGLPPKLLHQSSPS